MQQFQQYSAGKDSCFTFWILQWLLQWDASSKATSWNPSYPWVITGDSGLLKTNKNHTHTKTTIHSMISLFQYFKNQFHFNNTDKLKSRSENNWRWCRHCLHVGWAAIFFLPVTQQVSFHTGRTLHTSWSACRTAAPGFHITRDSIRHDVLLKQFSLLWWHEIQVSRIWICDPRRHLKNLPY